MVEIQLTHEESQMLRDILMRYLRDLQFEIADTDDRDFCRFLEGRKAFMNSLIERLQRAAA